MKFITLRVNHHIRILFILCYNFFHIAVVFLKMDSSFSWSRSEGATPLYALHRVGCERLLVAQRVQELPYRWVLAEYQRVEGVVVGLQGVCCTGRASSRPLQGVPHLDREVWCQRKLKTSKFKHSALGLKFRNKNFRGGYPSAPY